MEERLLGLEQRWALGQGLIPLVSTQGLGKSEGSTVKEPACTCYLFPSSSSGDFQVCKYIIFS